MIDSRKKIDRESSSEVRKMLGCLNQKYEILFANALLFVYIVS